jgi:hypothetical protein
VNPVPVSVRIPDSGRSVDRLDKLEGEGQLTLRVIVIKLFFYLSLKKISLADLILIFSGKARSLT